MHVIRWTSHASVPCNSFFLSITVYAQHFIFPFSRPLTSFSPYFFSSRCSLLSSFFSTVCAFRMKPLGVSSSNHGICTTTMVRITPQHEFSKVHLRCQCEPQETIGKTEEGTHRGRWRISRIVLKAWVSLPQTRGNMFLFFFLIWGKTLIIRTLGTGMLNDSLHFFSDFVQYLVRVELVFMTWL